MTIPKKNLLQLAVPLMLCAPLVNADVTPNYWEAQMGLGAAVRLQGDDALTRRAVNAQFSLEDDNNFGFYKAKARMRWDSIYIGDHPYSEEAEDAYRFDSDWRHVYIGKTIGDGELTFGLQQVVWGRADEVRVLDQINPQDFRDGIADLLDNSRIPVPMFRFIHPVKEWELETLFITDFKKNRAPEIGSEFYSPIFATPDIQEFSVQHAPGYNGEEGFAYGIHLNGNVKNIDTSILALNARQPDPVYLIGGLASDGRVRLQEEFPRYSMAGLGIAIDPGYSLMVRSELAYFHQWQFINLLSDTGVRENDMMKGLIGLDYLWRNWLLSMQWWRQHIINWQPGTNQQQQDDLFTISAEGAQFEDRLNSRLVLAASPGLADGFVQGIFKYRPNDTIRFGFQIDIYFGKQEMLFGSYDEHDNIQFSVDYLFN